MKKKYETPVVRTVEVHVCAPLVASEISSEVGLGYGGVDEDGTMNPSSRRGRNVWGEED